MTMNRWSASACALFVLVSGALFAHQLADEKSGLQVGQKAPDFKLQDQAGEHRQLASLLQNGNVALVFFRSASW